MGIENQDQEDQTRSDRARSCQANMMNFLMG